MSSSYRLLNRSPLATHTDTPKNFESEAASIPKTFEDFVRLAKEKAALDLNTLALKYYDKALQLKPDDAPTLLLKAEILSRVEHFTEALAVLNRASSINPAYLTQANFNFQKGQVYKSLRQLQAAVTSFKLALSQPGGPACKNIYLECGDAYSDLNEYKAAIDSFETAFRIKPATLQRSFKSFRDGFSERPCV